MVDLLFVDIESSGLDPERHSLIELAAARTSGDLREDKQAFEALVQFSREGAEPKALEIAGYREDLWRAKAVPLRVALANFHALADGPGEWAIVGHNITFDWMFLVAACRAEKLAIPKPRYTVDTLSMAWALKHAGLVESLSLDKLSARYGIAQKGAHRAMGDVRRTMILYCRLLGLPVPMRLE
jgi:DNA polymerase III epsilon subunit-like protein